VYTKFARIRWKWWN